ncbi:MAG: tripartite tricarboxylate transporter substrate binding protein [Candidatus Rokubacteria bacterium]|nr:tripartite tricarboxylate transporter substrate binding protein [Candidatus Rokubacteria bacterium]
MIRTLLLSSLAAASLLAGPGPARAEYPDRPIEVIVPVPPGGGLDLQARLLADVVEPFLKQKLVILNRPGGGGAVGMSVLLAAKPDGHTVAAVWNGPLTTNPHTQPVGYGVDDYVPIIQFSAAPFVLCAAPAFPANSGAELIEHLRKNPGTYTYGNEGAGGTLQLAAERIFRTLGVRVRPIAFRGASETLNNFLGGHITFYGGGVASILPHVKAGKAKCLLLTSAGKNEVLPQAASLTELAIPQAETVLWRAIIAPKGVPPERRVVLEAAFRQGAQSQRFLAFLKTLGETPMAAGPAEVGQLIRTELEELGKVARELGMKRP